MMEFTGGGTQGRGFADADIQIARRNCYLP
jgi:hypothetical protein